MFSLNPIIDNTGVKETVQTITLGTLFKDFNINKVDFMKLDVEGSEGA